MVLRGDGRDTANRAVATMTSTATEFHVTTTLEAFEAGRRVWAEKLDQRVPARPRVGRSVKTSTGNAGPEPNDSAEPAVGAGSHPARPG